MLLRHAIGAALRRIRLDDGRTLREVAGSANISMPYLSEIERGRKEPSSEILSGICDALGLTLVDLLQEATAEERGVGQQRGAVHEVRSLRELHEAREAHAAHRLPAAPGEIGLVAA